MDLGSLFYRTNCLSTHHLPTASWRALPRDILTKTVAKSILLIDGSTIDRRHYSSVVRAAVPGCYIVQAGSGVDGLKLYPSHCIDCVILELALPDMHESDVLHQLANSLDVPRIPLIVLTRLCYPTIGQFGKESGATATFVKKRTSDKVLQDAVLAALLSGSA